MKPKTPKALAAPKKGAASPAAPKPQSRAVARPAAPINIFDDAGVGMEDMGRDDLIVPRLAILQDNSPQVKKKDPAYIDGAEPGDILDTILKEASNGEKGIILIPVAYRRTHIEWHPRDSKTGKGFVADHGPDGDILNSCTKNDKGKFMTERGTMIVPTAEYTVFRVEEDGNANPFILTMVSTQMKKAKQWNSMLNQLKVEHPEKPGVRFTPAMFYRSYLFTTTPEGNDLGSWYGWSIKPGKFTLDLPGGDDLYVRAREFRKLVMEGKVSAGAPVEDAAASHGEDDGAPM